MGRYQMNATSPPVIEAILAKVGPSRSATQFKKGEPVFHQGDSADTVCYIESGTIKLTVVSEQGKKAVVAFVTTGEFFGEACLVGQIYRVATATALTHCAIVELEKASIVRMLREPEFSDLFIGYLLARTIRVEANFVDQLFNSTEKRLARLLLLLANFGKPSGPTPVLANISQSTLADMIGATRSSVSFFMNKFRRLGFIGYNGHIEVHSSLLSMVLHDDPELNQRVSGGLLPRSNE